MRTRNTRKGAQMFDEETLLRKTKLRKEEAAFLLDVTVRTVEKYMAAGQLEFIRSPGGRRKPLTSSVKKFL